MVVLLLLSILICGTSETNTLPLRAIMENDLLAAAVHFDLSLREDDPAVVELRRVLQHLQTLSANLRQRANQIGAESEDDYDDCLSMRLHAAANLNDVAAAATRSTLRALLSS